jgi:hypothetical protein
MAETREPGWYSDPWGTEDERYFDGSAWTRQVRPPGGASSHATPEATVAAPAATAPSSALGGASSMPTGSSTDRDVATTAPGGPPPAGWHADPSGEGTWRWWDGSQWTGYTDRTTPLSSSATVAAELATERTWARWARIALAVNPIFQVLALVAASTQWRWIADHWDEVVKGTNTTGPTNSSFGFLGLPTLFVTLGVIVLLILWLYRAGATARAAGLPLRRDPGLGAVSFIIPILNLWWPYRAARDAVGADRRAQSLVVRWWVAWLASSFGGIVVFGAAFLPEIFSIVAVAIVAAISIVAALTGRAVVNAMLATHQSLADAA